jgi:hypothetical protein
MSEQERYIELMTKFLWIVAGCLFVTGIAMLTLYYLY